MYRVRILLLFLSICALGSGPLLAAPRSLEEAILSSNWSWVNYVNGGRESTERIRFFQGGVARNPKFFTAHWEITGANTLVLKIKKNKASLTFNSDFTCYEGIDFNHKTKVWGVALDSVDPDPVSPDQPKSEPPGQPPAAAAPTASDVVHDHSASLVIVKSDQGSGSGFICKNGSSAFLYTNIHVMADLLRPTFTRLDGAIAAVDSADLAVGRDITRLKVTNPPDNPLEITMNFNDSVRIGDAVIVLGNSGGSGVVTSIAGAVVGIGPDRVEVSAPFVPGNSGSPIIHVKSGKVIGIATYYTSRNEDPTKKGSVTVRRFGYRIDNEATWEHLEWNAFRQDADGVKEVSTLTDDIFDFLQALRTKKTPTFKTETLRTPALGWMTMIRHHNLSRDGRRIVTENFLHALQRIVVADVLALEPRLRYTYFREEMHDQREIRKRLFDALSPESAEWSLR